MTLECKQQRYNTIEQFDTSWLPKINPIHTVCKKSMQKTFISIDQGSEIESEHYLKRSQNSKCGTGGLG